MALDAKLLVLVLDAASPQLLRSWAADGTLPNIASLLRSGLAGSTRSVEGLYLGATWPSFYTGVMPGGHGIFWLDQLEPGTYLSKPLTPPDFARRDALWKVLSEAGRRVVVLDVPVSACADDLNGIQVSEWGTHDHVFGFQTTPRGLKRTIVDMVGLHPAPAPCDAPHRSHVEYREFAERLIEGARKRAELTRQILARAPWDFAIQVFSETHCAGHHLWHYHDPGHPAFDATMTRDTGDLIRQVYQSVDTAVGSILSAVDAGTTVVLLTLHDMGHMSGYSRLLHEILLRLGAMHLPTRDRPAGPRTLWQRVTDAMRAAYHLAPEATRLRLFDMRVRFRQRWIAPGISVAIDPDRTRCFQIDLGSIVGAIRLNLRGREPSGTLSPGTEADRFCEDLTRELLDLTNPDSGQRLVKRVRRTADLFSGPEAHRLPDLLVEWDLEVPLGSSVVGTGSGATMKAYSPRIGLIEEVNAYCRTGEHRIDGMFVACGPNIMPGRLDRVVSNIDLAPTFARILGCAMPSVDGAVIPELVRAPGASAAIR